jgi:ribonuclease E
MSDPTTGQALPGQPTRPGAATPSPAAPADRGVAPLANEVSPPPRPKIGDSRPAPIVRVDAPSVSGGAPGPATANGTSATNGDGAGSPAKPRRRRRGGRGRGGGAGRATGADAGGREESREGTDEAGSGSAGAARNGTSSAARSRQRPAAGRGGGEGAGTDGRAADAPVTDGPVTDRTLGEDGRHAGSEALSNGAVRSRSRSRAPVARLASTESESESDSESESESEAGDGESARPGASKRRRGRERNGRPVGRYLMCVHVRPEATQIAVLEGRSLIEHHVARSQDDVNQIDGNLYRGRVKNVLPGMEAAFVDIGTPKNAVLYWGDVQFDRDDAVEREPGATRIEHLLRPGQTIVCQVTKNPIGLKGARLTEEVSIPGRFVVLVPNSSASGISKRLDDSERKRLRKVLEEIRPEGHGVIVRTAAEGVSADELRKDVDQLLAKWGEIEEKAKRLPAPALLYSEPHLALRVIREEFTEEYRGIVIDDRELYELVRAYVADIDPALADRVELFDTSVEPLPLFERHHVHEQLHKALDRKVWLPSGGSLIIERTEALTVIDVNTGKNVGSSSLEETVFRNNLEAADEIARQLRLRDIGGIIVIDFIDMEVKANRQEVMTTLRGALARDKTPTQVFDISELGLVEMTRKRVGEGLVEALSEVCPVCKGRGIVFQDLRD